MKSLGSLKYASNSNAMIARFVVAATEGSIFFYHHESCVDGCRRCR